MSDFRDEIQLLALTVAMETGGEDDVGMLAVAWVVMTRYRLHHDSVIAELFAPYQFSSWNTTSRVRQTVWSLHPTIFERAYRAACAAYFSLLPDPTAGATHYLNEDDTRAASGALPTWYDPAKITAKIGHHTFLRL